jgi:hypothetical protein
MTWQDIALIMLVADRVIRGVWETYAGAKEAARQERIIAAVEADSALQAQRSATLARMDLRRRAHPGWVAPNASGKSS